MRKAIVLVLLFSLLFSSCYSLKIDKSALNENQEDILYMFNALMNRHKDFLHDEDRENAEIIASSLIERNSTLDPIEFFFSLQRIAALSKDSHTQSGVNSDIRRALKWLPLDVSRVGNDFVITGATEEYESLIGRKIVGWEGKNRDNLMDMGDIYLSYDNPVNRVGSLFRLITVGDFYKRIGLISFLDDGILIESESPSGERREDRVYFLDYDKYEDFIKNGIYLDTSSFPETYPNKSYYRTIELGDDAIMFQYNSATVEKGRWLRPEVYSFLNRVRDGNYKSVIIDLRYNQGGLIPRLISLIDGLEEIKDEKDFNLYTLIGPLTFSAAVINANRIENHMEDNIFVGMPTGGSSSHYGGVSTFSLPNSKIEVSFSHFYFNNKGITGPIEPDIYIEERFEDLLEGKDTALEYILK